jgi:polyhydroxybutyrate depolymerase
MEAGIGRSMLRVDLGPGVRGAAVALALLLVAAACRQAASEGARGGAGPSAGCRTGTLPALEGERRELDGRVYLIDAPAASADEPLPLVLAFHGFRGSPEDLRGGTGLSQLAQRERFVAVYPAGHQGVELLGTTGRGWDLRPDQTRDRDFVVALLDRLEQERCVDRHRVFATGMSNGGFFSSLLGCQLPDRLAAVAPVAGALALKGCPSTRPVPIMLMYGSRDPVVPPDMVSGAVTWWADHNGCRSSASSDGCTRWSGCAAEVVACEGTQGHMWPFDATDRIWRFFSAQSPR